MLRALLLLLLGGLTACQSAPLAAASERRSVSLEVGGLTRTATLYQPAGLGSGPHPLIVALHGGWGSGSTMAEQTGLDALAERQGFLVVYPDGVGRAWNAGTCCAGPVRRNIDDVGFIRALVQRLVETEGADPARVYGTGFSNGAMLLHRVACEAPTLFRAIAPVSGGPMTGTACDARQPVPALLIQGRLDNRIPWDGGEFEGSFRPAMRDIVAGLAQRNGCEEAETVIQRDEGLTCWERRGCKGAPVQWCGLDTVGHQWPGGRSYLPRLLGPNTERFRASERIVAFFQQFR